MLDKIDHKKFRRLVGQVLWVSSVRRDVAFPVKELSKHAHDPTTQDMQNAMHLLKYLKGTMDECVYIKPVELNKKFELTVFTDADLGGCRTSRKSTSGGCIALNGAIFHTWAKQQNTIADSSAESEFNGLAQACKEVKYVLEVLDEMDIILHKPPRIYIDNTSAMSMVEKNVKSRVKHLDRKVYWIREFIANGNVIVKHVDGKLNLADLFTKFVSTEVMTRLRPAVMGRSLPPTEVVETPKKKKTKTTKSK